VDTNRTYSLSKPHLKITSDHPSHEREQLNITKHELTTGVLGFRDKSTDIKELVNCSIILTQNL
jgi:hypothetical protein